MPQFGFLAAKSRLEALLKQLGFLYNSRAPSSKVLLISRTLQPVLLGSFDYFHLELPWVQVPSAASLWHWRTVSHPNRVVPPTKLFHPLYLFHFDFCSSGRQYGSLGSSGI